MRGVDQGHAAGGGGHGGVGWSLVGPDWHLHAGPTERLRDRVATRKSAFDRLSGQLASGVVSETVLEPSLNEGGVVQSGQLASMGARPLVLGPQVDTIEELIGQL